jgi:NAD(P)-dependent dehydrogenase (short-subunit alcohol dehydrogenase family)
MQCVVAANFKGPFRLAAIVGSRMAAAGGGAIVNISSIGAIRAQPAYAPYASANAATEAHAFEFAPKVRVMESCQEVSALILQSTGLLTRRKTSYRRSSGTGNPKR